VSSSPVRAIGHGLDAAIASQAQLLDSLAKAVQSPLASAVRQTGPVGQLIKDLLHGVWLGHPLHPALTDIPIGAWTTGLLFDLVGLDDSADAAYVLGVLGAVPTAMSGTADWLEITDEPRRVGFVHAILNIGAVGLIVASLRARRTGRRALGIGLSVSGFTLSAVSAWLGGELVYRQGTSISRNAFDPPVPEFQVAASADSLKDGVLTGGSVRVDGREVHVVLLKRGTEVFALNGVCSHAGGPLAEGKLVDANCVECPWHHSHFSMTDGSVHQGPASIEQPVFETRIRDGNVEVRL
jgi:nitrite reductase/ring-hydroxylating ferredoxin subunit